MNPPINPPALSEVVDVTNGLLASISHDLGTPLSAILLWTKVLSEQDEVPQQELRDGLQAIRECVEEQLAIIEDIVDTSRIATGRTVLKPERVDFAALLSGVIENFKQLADDMALELREDFDAELGTVLADPRRLKQAAGSMVGNAIARSPRGATVGISCVRRGNSVEISVSDSGDGIGAEAIQKALNYFPAKHSPPNKGTTLYTAAKLARLFGGQLDIRSDEGKTGARCTLTLILPVVAREGESIEEEDEREAMTPQKLIRYLSSQTEHISAEA